VKAGESIFILKNENKLYSEIAKLLKISRSSVYYTLKNFGPKSFSSHKKQFGQLRKATKLDDKRVVIINKRDHHLTALAIIVEINESLPMYASCIPRTRIWIHWPRDIFPLPNCSMLMFFGSLQTFALILFALNWFLR
jgi:hypothetical protein